MKVPARIIELVETFNRNIDSYKGPNYNETQVRREFIDPFFVELGWDVNNTNGLAEAYKDVIHEDSIKIGDALKAPDYCFRIGGTRKFFVEAKNPSINIKDAPSPAFQLRRYAWSAKLPLSILTDFEELAVYDCRVKPLKNDRSSTARTKYFKYTEYSDRWNEIASIFSKDAILKGSFDNYALSNKRKKGTAEVDAAFLVEIEKWRDILARNIALRNNSLTNRQLNYAVQRTIDRIIFLRIAEDRGIEQYAQLQGLINGQDIYPRLFKIFEQADDRYNSGLFHFTSEPGRTDCDEISETLIIDDKPLKDILKSLYYPDCPYAFSVLPAEILGQVYEQFLGKVITLTPAHRAKIEDKPEVKKAGGVYYTPKYIVDYIVENTIGKLLENKTPTSAAKLKILDPACGSGSFLIGAYQYLLDWHLKYYTENDPEKHTKAKEPRLYKTDKNEFRLTVAERKRILTNNIFGVDIDSQAVEVTKLSLLLKVLEGEKQLVLFHRGRALPDLSNNIKCGNSLIGPDFYKNQQMLMFDEEEQYKINAFDWKTEFPEILNKKNPGFNTVIGNPPYLAGREWETTLHSQRSYFAANYSCMTDQYDLYALFIQKAVDSLCIHGAFGFITPNTWLNNKHYESLRHWLAKRLSITVLADYREVKVFSKATVLPIVFVAVREQSPNIKTLFPVETFASKSSSTTILSSLSTWKAFPYCVFNLSIATTDLPLLKKIEAGGIPLRDMAEVRFGVKVYQKGKGKPPQKGHEATQKLFESKNKTSPTYHPYIRGKYVTPWNIQSHHAWLNYGPHLAEPRSIDLFKGPRILLRRIVADRLILSPTAELLIADQLLHTIKPNTGAPAHLYIAGILHSPLISYYFRKRFNRTESTFPEIRIAELGDLPIAYLQHSPAATKSHHDKMVSLVESMLDLNRKLPKAKTAHEKTILQRQITATDNQIDKLVYKLYNLTDEEIKIIEDSTK